MSVGSSAPFALSPSSRSREVTEKSQSLNSVTAVGTGPALSLLRPWVAQFQQYTWTNTVLLAPSLAANVCTSIPPSPLFATVSGTKTDAIIVVASDDNIDCTLSPSLLMQLPSSFPPPSPPPSQSITSDTVTVVALSTVEEEESEEQQKLWWSSYPPGGISGGGGKCRC